MLEEREKVTSENKKSDSPGKCLGSAGSVARTLETCEDKCEMRPGSVVV